MRQSVRAVMTASFVALADRDPPENSPNPITQVAGQLLRAGALDSIHHSRGSTGEGTHC
jgi:hypothetical protein